MEKKRQITIGGNMVLPLILVWYVYTMTTVIGSAAADVNVD